MAERPTLWRIEDGKVRLSLHTGQQAAWDSLRRFVIILAGTQSGKTSYIPWLLQREILRTCNPAGGDNDYIAATSTFDLFKLKFLPEMLEVFEGILKTARYWKVDRILELKDPKTGKFWAKSPTDRMWGRIILRSASSDGGLESSTARGAALDEMGMADFTIETWEAILRRLSLHRGRVLGATTLYDLGFIKTHIYDRWKAGDTDFDIINFDSTENPNFPAEEFERARNSMPLWRFNMFYRGIFTRPAGLIYDSFIDTLEFEGGHKIKPRGFSNDWFCYTGLDFGQVNTAATQAVAEERDGELTGRYLIYNTYHGAGDQASTHVRRIMADEPRIPIACGGARSEGEWRRQYSVAGMHVSIPATNMVATSVEVGIDTCYGAFQNDRVRIFDTETGFLEQLRNYSRELDDRNEPTEKIKDKERYHYLDSWRYLASYLFNAHPFFEFKLKRHTIKPTGVPWVGNLLGGLRYADDEPAAFVLCGTGENGRVYVLDELYEVGLSPTACAERIAGILSKYQDGGLDRIAIVANPDIFLKFAPGKMSGRAISEEFKAAGVRVVQSGDNDINGFAQIKQFLDMDALSIVRERCYYLCASIWITAHDAKTPLAPFMEGPVFPVQALGYALMSKPRPSNRMTLVPHSTEYFDPVKNEVKILVPPVHTHWALNETDTHDEGRYE